MKLIGESVEIEKSGLKEEASFGIADENMGLVLDMLRSKMYADPISAICREIACNARDAHREVGTPDKPIRINLPSSIDPHYRVIDEGPGITPDRIKTVFINFGSSTKRSDNMQTGGFGLGAKTPFAYCDQFQIITVTDISGPREVESLPRMKRTYAAYIDETKRGVLALMEEIETDLPRGTQISIPVKVEHFSEFAKKTENACRWWDTQPVLEGTENPFRKIDAAVTMEGPAWKIYDTSGGRYYGSNGSGRPLILIDGISYTLSDDLNVDRYYATPEEKQTTILFGGNKLLLLTFPNGQLTLSPNRETIHWSVDTKKLVKDKLVKIAEDIRKRLSKQVEACDNYTDAFHMAKKLRGLFTSENDASILKLTWHGHTLVGNFTHGHGKTNQWYSFSLARGVGERRLDRDDAGNFYQMEERHISRDKCDLFTLSWTGMLMINDVNLGMLSPKKAAMIFNQLPRTISSFTLVPDVHCSERTEIGEHLQFIPYMRLSAFMGKQEEVAKERKVRKLIYRHSLGGIFNLSSIEDFEKDARAKLWVVLDRDKYDNRLTWSTRKNSVDLLAKLSKEYKVTIYGAEKTLYDKSPSSFAEFETECTPVIKFVEDLLAKFDAKALKPFFQHAQNHARPFVDAFTKILPELKCQAEFIEYVRLDGVINSQVELARQAEFYLNVFDRSLRSPNEKENPPGELIQCDAIILEIMKRYPLLKHVSGDLFSDEMRRAYVSYVNMIDANKAPITKKQPSAQSTSPQQDKGN